MGVQARAEATREAIISAATDLFSEVGYGATDMTDIIARAKVTKGALYYHFPTKESLAAAIIEDTEARIQDVVLQAALSSRSPALENLVRSHFLVASMTQNDKRARVGNLLRQALIQVSPAGPATYSERRAVFVSLIKSALAEGDIRSDIDPDEVAHATWAAGLGNRLLSDATGDDVFAGLAAAWRVILAGIVVPSASAHYRQFVTDLAQQDSA